MKIESFKDLQKLMKLCRRNNASWIRLGDVEFNIELKSIKSPKSKVNTDVFPEELVKVPAYSPMIDATPDKIETEELTYEQLMFYSSQPETTE